MSERIFYFYIIAIPAIMLFLYGFIARFKRILSGNIDGAGRVLKTRDFLIFITDVINLFFTRRILKAFFTDVLIQRRLYRESLQRWIMSVCLAWGFMELFFIGSLGDMLHERGVVYLPKDTPVFAFLNEIGGLLVLIGVCIAFYRRLFKKPIELITEEEDIIIIGWIAIITLTGFLTEAVRLIIQDIQHSTAIYSFIGYCLSLILRKIQIDWRQLDDILWYMHAILSIVLIAVIPFTKLFHIFSSSLNLMLEAREK